MENNPPKNTVSMPMINRLSLDLLYGGAEPPQFYNNIPLTPYVPLSSPTPNTVGSGLVSNTGKEVMSLEELRNLKSNERRFDPSRPRTRAELTDESGRYEFYSPNYDNEDAYAQNQGWTTKAFNGVTKGLALTGTTFLQTTVGLVNGVYQAASDGRLASFYDNDFSRTLDEFNQGLEKQFASYETKEFRDADWYSPSYLLTGNFLWEGIIKNLGFAAGAALSGGVFTAGLKMLPGTARLFSQGKAIEAIAKSESAIAKGSSVAQGLGEIKALSDSFIGSYNMLNPAGRAIVAGLATTGEAGIEAYHNLNEWRDAAIEAYIEENGVRPSGDDLKKINELADGVGNSSMALNTLLLTATNYIQFPKILGSSYTAEKAVANGLAKPINDIRREAGRYVADIPVTKAGKRFNTVRKALTSPYLFSYSEAFEEGSQFAISKATEDYYGKKNSGEDVSWLSSILEGYKETVFSEDGEGMKNVLIGGLSGALMLAKGKYKQSRALSANTTAALSNSLSNPGLNTASLSDFTKDTFDAVQRGVTLQKEQEAFVAEGNILDTKDIEADYMFNYLSPRIKYGRFDLVKADINDYKQVASTEEGFQQLIKEGKAQATDTQEAFLARLSRFEDVAENVKSLYQSLNMRYAGQYDTTGTKRLYSDQVIEKMVYAASKIADYDVRIPQIISELPLEVTVDLDAAIDSAVANDNTGLEAIEKIVNANNKITKDEKQTIVEKMYDAASMAVRRNNFLQEYDAIKDNPSEFETTPITTIPTDAPKDEIKIKTKKGEKTVTTNTEYYLMEDTRMEDLSAVRKPYILTILEELPNGDLKVQFSDGRVKTVPKKEFETWNLGSVKETHADPKADFMMKNLNSKFTHYGIKLKKGPNGEDRFAEGRLEYSNKDKALIFAYTDDNGKIKRREVYNSMFVAKEGFSGAMVRRIGTATAEEAKAENRFKKAKLTMSEKLTKRNEIVQSLYENTLSELTKVTNQLEASNNRLKNLPQEIENAYKTKDGKPRARITKPITKLVNELTKLKETLPKDIEILSESKENLESQLGILKEFLSDMDTMPQDSMSFINTLKKDISDLDEMIELSTESIDKAEKQKSLVDQLYEKAMDLYNDLVKRLIEENPGIPLSIDSFREGIEKFLGIEGAQNLIDQRLGFTNAVLEVENALLEFEGDLKIPALSKRSEILQRDIQELTEGVDALIEEQIAKQKILEAFRDAYTEYKRVEQEESILRENSQVQQALLNTQDKQEETQAFADNYNPQSLKSVQILPLATVAANDGKEHQKRANTFGINLPNIKETKEIRGVYITEKNQDLLVPGLIDKLRTSDDGVINEDIDASNIIALVMVTETSGGKIVPVDVNGDPISEDSTDVLNEAIYQVMPLPTFTYGAAGKNNSMFREGTPQEVQDEIIEKYTQWRENIKENESVNDTVDVHASFGKIINVVDENKVPIGETPVTDAGFITDDNLETNAVIKIPTTETELSKGTTSFLSPFKRVFLETINGYVKLNNKRHSVKKAETIYKAVLALANEMIEDPDGAKSAKAKRLISFLQGTTYWGIPTYQDGKAKENIGYSSLFFKVAKNTNDLLLHVGKAATYVFTPIHLEARKEEIIADITKLYTNTNNAMAQAITQDFEEITDITDSGEIVSTIWPNYQTYLLSNKLPDESGKISNKSKKRNNDEIPLTTHAQPISAKNPENRISIYFWASTNEEYFAVEPKAASLNFKDLPTEAKTVEEKFAALPANVKNQIVALPKAERPAIIEKAYRGMLNMAAKNNTPISQTIPAVAEEEDNRSYEEILDEAESLFPGVKQTFMNGINDGKIPADKILSGAKSTLKFAKAKSSEQRAAAVPDLMDQEAGLGPEPLAPIETLDDGDGDGGDNTGGLGEASLEDAPVLPPPVQEPAEKVSTMKSFKELQAAAKAKGTTTNKRKTNFRKVIQGNAIVENWEEVENFLKKNFPNIPVYRVNKVITDTNGDKNWGMFQDGALYIYKNAEVGTTYHEVFEAVWKMFTPVAEQESIINEFTSREGTFIDRPSGETIKYNEATPQQIKEQLAEEFRNYVMDKTIPAKPSKGRPFILKLFSDLVNFIRTFFDGSAKANKNAQALFENIYKGKYKSISSPLISQLSYVQRGIIDIDTIVPTLEADFSKIPNITDTEMNDIVQEMLYNTLTYFLDEDRDLFSNKPVSIRDLNLQNSVIETIERGEADIFAMEEEGIIDEDQAMFMLTKTESLKENIVKQWDSLYRLYRDRIAAFDLIIDENDEIQITAEDKIRNSDYVDATKVDSIKKINSAIKLLLSTVPVVDQNEVEEVSEINGVVLLSFNQVSKTLMQKLHNSVNIDDMVSRFRELAEENPSYRKLYRRFTQNSWADKDAGFENINSMQQFRMLSGLWRSFSLQAPSVKNVFILENGETQVGDAALSSSASQLRSAYLNAITLRSKSGQGFYTFNVKENRFIPNIEKLRKFKLDFTDTSYSLFLKELGIDFTVPEMQKLTGNQKKQLKEAVSGVYESILTGKPVYNFSGKSLNLHKRLLQIGLIKSAQANPEFETTYFNVAGERSQTYIGGNVHSRMYKILSQVNNISDLKSTQYAYLLDDVFSQGSLILKKMFSSVGTPIRDGGINGQNLMEVGVVGGTINEAKGKSKSSANLNYKERLIQELNLNLEGWYLNLVPGDSTTEWMTFIGNHVTSKQLSRGFQPVFDIFKDYFISEINLSRDNRNIVNVSGRNAKDLRFFKGILGKELHNKIIRSTVASGEVIYEKNKEAIEKAIVDYIQERSDKLKTALNRYQIAQETLGTVKLENINTPEAMSVKAYEEFLQLSTINYAIANIEMHKLIYSDPYQYKDELKRTKSSNSPRQEVLNSSNKVNSLMNKVWNKNFTPDSLGYTNFMRDFFRTATLTDVSVVNEFKAYNVFKETDGGGLISFKAYRNFKLRSSDWTEENERQYRYDVVWEKNDKGMELSTIEKVILNAGNPGIKDSYTSLKPIVSGNRANGQTFHDTVLDKYALFPLSYRVAKESGAMNMVRQHNKMQNEDIDYVVFNSGRKVGAHASFSPYNADGSFNETPYSGEEIINIPFAIIGQQVEIPSKEGNSVTKGSQVTKLVTMDKMDAGVPLDFNVTDSFVARFKQWNALSENEKIDASEIYKEIVHNRNLLRALTEDGFNTILDKLGIVKTERGFDFGETGVAKLIDTLKSEVLSRSANDNILDALNSFLEETSVLEATPAYYQISNILYSIVDKQIVHTKMNGGMKVQLPSTFWEENRLALTKINGKEGYTSEVLGFYSKGTIDPETGKKSPTNIMEIMVGRWFDSPNMTDAELLDFLNNTEEGQKILRGFAYRIPTQNTNSIDAFRIKKFLPKEFGDNVVVPAAIVAKVGSDFDIDKLSIYFKNVFFNELTKKPQLVPYFGIGKDALNKAFVFADQYYYDMLGLKESKLEKNTTNAKMFSDLYLGKKMDPKIKWRYVNLFRRWFQDEMIAYGDNPESLDLVLPIRTIEGIFMERAVKLGKSIDKLSNEEKFAELIDRLGKKLYKEGLQNEFIESSINLITHPQNFEKLTSPNSAQELEDLSNEVSGLIGNSKIEYTNPDNFLDRLFMSELRHAFVTGKKAIGIAALGQTNNAINQQQLIYMDVDKIKDTSTEDNEWLKVNGGGVNFKDYNYIFLKGKKRPTLSMMKNASGQYISDIVGMFIDGFVDISNGPWIMKLGATPNVVATWLYLLKIGVPLRDVAGFMNQPIIRDYLEKLETSGYAWLYIRDYVDDIKNSTKYVTTDTTTFTTIDSDRALFQTIGKEELSPKERNQQHFYLDEFLKYSKMANQLFFITQGSSYDTANFNNPYLLYKKQLQYESAQNSIFSSIDSTGKTIPAIDALLDNTFLRQTKNSLEDSRDALTTVLVSDTPNVREVLHKVLYPYRNKSDRDFVEVAKKAVTGLFDWAVQNSSLNNDVKFNNYIESILISNDNVSREMNRFVKAVKRDPSHPLFNNEVINLFEAVPSRKAEQGGTDNVKIRSIGTEVYDQNKLIYAFRELKEFLKNDKEHLYDRLLMLAVLQSGLSASNISFTSSIPFEDFSKIYNGAMSSLETIPNLQDYVNLAAFERNNWHTSDIIPSERAIWIETSQGRMYNPGMAFLPRNVVSAINDKKLPPMLKLGVGFNTNNSNHVTYSWEKQLDLLTDEEHAYIKKNNLNKFAFLNEKKNAMKKAGDYSYVNKSLFEKVINPITKEPLIDEYTKNGVTRYSYIYKAINAWGNGSFANEYYDVARPSVINNGFMKIENEVDNTTVIGYFDKKAANVLKSKGFVQQPLELELITRDELLEDYSQTTGETIGDTPRGTMVMQPDNVQKILSGTKTTTIRESIPKGGFINVGQTKVVNFGGKDFNVTNRGKLSIQEAGGIKTMLKSEGVKKISDLMFKQSQDWFNGKGKMYVFDIVPLEKEALPTNTIVSKNTTINIYAGTNENTELSNFATRPFEANISYLIGDENYTMKKGFKSVEHAFQYAKGMFVDKFKNTEYNNDILEKITTAGSASSAKALGKQLKNLDTRAWDYQSTFIMKDLLKQSFEQNPKALQNLLNTGNATLTHTQDRSKWGKEFPRLLMEVRSELSNKSFVDPFENKKPSSEDINNC